MKTLKPSFTFLVVVLALLVMYAGNLPAQEEKTDSSRFSHNGLKVSIAMGKANPASDLNLNTGNLFSLSLGYGFFNNFTVWLSGGSAQHRNKPANNTKTSYVNFELGLQYKFLSQSRLQPYGKFSGGVYLLNNENSDVTDKVGNGFALAAGADYFFSRHFGFGVEVNYKLVDFTEEFRKVGGETKSVELDPALNGDSVSFMIAFTIQ